jgi:hypothetical protein
VLLRAFLDPFVDRPKDFFVLGGRVGEVHEGIVPRSVPDAKRREVAAQTPCDDSQRPTR